MWPWIIEQLNGIPGAMLAAAVLALLVWVGKGIRNVWISIGLTLTAWRNMPEQLNRLLDNQKEQAANQVRQCGELKRANEIQSSKLDTEKDNGKKLDELLKVARSQNTKLGEQTVIAASQETLLKKAAEK